MPDGYKRAVVDALLSSMGPDGKVIFIDYHGPHRFHPMRPILKLIFNFLEPFAESLWRHPITDFATRPEDFTWKSETYFGGLYQKTIARHR